MILAAGLTPAWQQILMFDQLTVGHVNRAQSTLWCGSGKVLNVGAALHHLGADSLTICPVGGATGHLIRQDFERRGIAAVWLTTQANTRVCTTLLDRSSRVTTELVENSAALTESELSAYVEAFAEASRTASLIVLSGSLPQGTPASFYRRLLERSAAVRSQSGQTSARVILDVRGRELNECLPLKPFLVKPNREELSATVGRPLETETALIAAMSDVRGAGAEWIVVSQGSGPLLAMGPDGIHRIQPPSVNVVNPIGCGDSLTAAIAHQLDANVDPVAAIHFGARYAARKASILFPVLQRSIDDAEIASE